MRFLARSPRHIPSYTAGLLAGLFLLVASVWGQNAPDLATLRTKAGKGDLEAQNMLGNAHSNALLGLQQDYAEAIRWYRQAGDKGFAPAQFNLGLAYELGRGVAVDERQAFKFYLMAAEQGFAPAQFNVGNMYAAGRGVGQDLFEANLWYKQSAESGLVEAQFNLGLVYETGRGVKKDDVAAAKWYKVAAERGYARAQHNYAILLEEGRGVAKDTAAAAVAYRAAAEQNFAPAQINYGLMLAEGRDRVARDPVQAYVWLSRAVQNGGSAEARDNLARTLSSEQMAAAQQAGGARIAVPAPAAAAPAPAVSAPPVPAADAATASRVVELTEAIAQARDANSRLAEANQRLEVDNARLKDEVARAGGSDQLVGQLRDQSRRLSEQVQSLTADKEAAERQNTILTAQVRDAERDLATAKAAVAPPAPAMDVSSFEGQIAALTAKLSETTESLKQLQTVNADLLAANQRLQQEKDAIAAKPVSAPGAVLDPATVANIQKENVRLNDEVKRASRELLNLNRQIRNMGDQAKAGGGAPAADTQQVAQLTAKAQQAAEDSARLQEDNKRLAARIAELEAQPKPAANASGAKQLAETQQQVASLQEQLTSLQSAKADLKQQADALEKKLAEQAASTKGSADEETRLRRQLADAQGKLAEREQTLSKNQQALDRLTAAHKDLEGRLAQTEGDLRKAAGRAASSSELATLKEQLSESQSRAVQMGQDNRQLSARLTAEQQGAAQVRDQVANLERQVASLRAANADSGPTLDKLRGELGEATRRAELLATANADLQGRLNLAEGAGASIADLRRQLAEATQALEKSSASAGELTAANQKLESELAAARRGSADTASLQTELNQARRELAEMATLRRDNQGLREEASRAAARPVQDPKLVSENEQLTRSLAESRRDLTAAQGRVTDLEGQLADALTVRTRQATPAGPRQADLDEANRTVERLNATVADLTAANQKLEQDLESAQKSTAAALAAQAQAVSAANPDAFKSEISTLNDRVKQLEAQLEDDRAGAAKEIATLAGQLQRTRESNRSLTEANRALLAAKESDTSATRDETAQLEGRVRELTAAHEELRRQGQQQAAQLRTITSERDEARGQLVDARKVATVLPGMADEKAALQERLEAVGGQLVQLQQDHEQLQKANADLTQQLAASRDAAQQAQADLTAVQAKMTEADKADASHTQTVAELTQANEKLGLEREDMRRLVDSYRADIARLTQNVRAAEQQRTAAEQSGQQNIDAVTAQMAQLRRDLEAARANQGRLAEGYAAQERERLALITQLRTENGALAARLNQAQGTLDQIAAAARLGTPAATIASGGLAPVQSAPTITAAVRFHTVTEGDSLSRISLRYYGTPNRWQEIYAANRDVLQGSSALRVGQQLRIP